MFVGHAQSAQPAIANHMHIAPLQKSKKKLAGRRRGGKRRTRRRSKESNKPTKKNAEVSDQSSSLLQFARHRSAKSAATPADEMETEGSASVEGEGRGKEKAYETESEHREAIPPTEQIGELLEEKGDRLDGEEKMSEDELAPESVTNVNRDTSVFEAIMNAITLDVYFDLVMKVEKRNTTQQETCQAHFHP